MHLPVRIWAFCKTGKTKFLGQLTKYWSLKRHQQATFSQTQAFIHWHPFFPQIWTLPLGDTILFESAVDVAIAARVLAAASVGGLEALFSLTSDLARLSWHIETRRTSWLDDQCTNLFEALLRWEHKSARYARYHHGILREIRTHCHKEFSLPLRSSNERSK